MDVVTLYKQVMRPGAHGRLFCSPLQLAQCYKTLSRTMGEEESDCIDGEGIVNKEVGGKMKAFFEV